MQPDFKGFLSYTRDKVPELNIEGLHYAITPSPRKKGNAVAICFDVSTNNPNFFGQNYRNSIRQKFLGMLYERVFDEGENFLGMDFDLDFYAQLRQPYKFQAPESEGELKEGVVDVTVDNKIKYLSMKEAASEEWGVQEGSSLDRYCKKYGLTDMISHGFHIIGPDPGTIDTLEALIDAKEVNSIIEFGGGVGSSGVVAKRRGIMDFTFVDLNPTVCKYLERKLPFYVVNSDISDFKFDRHYDVAILGVPYELNPSLLEKKGQEIADHVDVVIVQSGGVGFFQFEHDWVFGRNSVRNWPWFKPEQTLERYFDRGSDHVVEYQTMIVAGNDDFRAEEEEAMQDILKSMGAKDIEYNFVR